jgi:hypothetical protein
MFVRTRPPDNLTQLGAIGYDDEVNRQAASGPRLGRAGSTTAVRPKGKRFDHVSMLLMEMRLFHESLCFDRALFQLRTLSLVIWLAEIEARSVEM